MNNTLGTNMTVTIYGESHGPAIGAILDGLAPGMPVDEEFIAHQLMLRRPAGKISTARKEADPVEFLSGVFEGHTTGTSLCLMIRNADTHSSDYSKMQTIARPGHADYTAFMKYHGFSDYRGGGHFSGRITAALVAAGGIVIPALKAKGIEIGTHIRSCGGVQDREFADYAADFAKLSGTTFAVLDDAQGEKMTKVIEEAAAEGDSVGGVLETAVTGMPAGVGEPWFDTLESLLSHGLFSIPAIKGVEFGDAFAMVNGRGSAYNDAIRMEEGVAVTKTNHNGGINGGITNGMPIVFRCAVKPTPSIYKQQETIDFKQMENTDLQIQGRHDPAIIHRARVVVDSVTALILYDALVGRYGTDYFCPEQ